MSNDTLLTFMESMNTTLTTMEENSITTIYSYRTIMKNYETPILILLILVCFLVARAIPKTARMLKGMLMTTINFLAQRCLHRNLTTPEEEVVEDVIEGALGVTDTEEKR